MTETPTARRDWPLPTALITLSLVPMAAGAVRLAELSSGADVTPDNARFFAAPLPVVLHIVGATVYLVLGAFQFAPGLRRRRPGWHRTAGRLAVPCGLVGALSGLWMALFVSGAHEGAVLTGVRLVFGSAMVVAIALGFTAVRRRDITRHRAWMIRGYAIGQGAGTQALVLGPWVLILGQLGDLTTALLMATAWFINIAVAERIIRGRPARPTHVTARLFHPEPVRTEIR